MEKGRQESGPVQGQPCGVCGKSNVPAVLSPGSSMGSAAQHLFLSI